MSLLESLDWFSIGLQIVIILGFSLYYYWRGIKEGRREVIEQQKISKEIKDEK